MPLFPLIEARLRVHLLELEQGGRPPMIGIGEFTDAQFRAINQARFDLDLHLLESNEVLFLGRHLYQSRSADGYSVDDMITQIMSAMDVTSTVIISLRMSAMKNLTPRADGYGNMVYDQAIFEMTSRKPKAELFSVIPKGDSTKP